VVATLNSAEHAKRSIQFLRYCGPINKLSMALHRKSFIFCYAQVKSLFKLREKVPYLTFRAWTLWVVILNLKL